MTTPHLFSFFTDAILRGPTLGCMLMCLAASLIGVVVVLRKQSLMGEALSHAAYPGLILGALAAGLLTSADDLSLALWSLSFAFATAVGGLCAIHALIKHVRVPADAALCFVLSTFFGIGLTLTSEVQFSFTSLYKQVMTYLYGQAATMTDDHIAIYGCFACVVILIVISFYKELQALIFDRQYAKSLGIPVKFIDAIVFTLVGITVIIGIRSVGVILMSAMLIAPAVAARQFTNRLSMLFLLSAAFGMTSGFFGNYFSVYFTHVLAQQFPAARIVLPTGPMIVLVATAICILALLLAPERGLLVRLLRIGRFRYRSHCENILKAMWRSGPEHVIDLNQITCYQSASRFYLKLILNRMVEKGWITNFNRHAYQLTSVGKRHAAKIVRLHRLWEVYLTHYLEMGAEKVHRNAEEMEHILTPELEQQLVRLLNDPKEDPHQQPIPSREGLHAL